MRSIVSATVATILFFVSFGSARDKGMQAPNFSVGSGLEVVATVTLSSPAMGELPIQLKSSNPRLLLLSVKSNEAGSESITVMVPSGSTTSNEFYLQGIGDSGKASYEARAAGFGITKGTVTLGPSSIVMKGIRGLGKPVASFEGSPQQKFTLMPALLSPSGEYLQQELLAGGNSISVTVSSSNPAAGVVNPSTVTIKGGDATAVAHFEAGKVGETELTASLPDGFRISLYSTVKANVDQPGIALTDQLYIGHDLQIECNVGLGKFAPEGGVTVTLTSDDPSRLLISSSLTEPGSKSLSIRIPEGELRAKYYLQALGDDGKVTYSASAPGFTKRTATMTLGPSGILMGMAGPPDENELMSKESGDRLHGFGISLSRGTTPIHIYTALLHPTNHRGADITVQPLRPGMSLQVELQSSDPLVGTITSPVTIASPKYENSATLTLLKAGSTVLSLKTPSGFTTAANATSIKATVMP